MLVRSRIIAVVMALTMSLLPWARQVRAQQRMSDKDVENTMKNLTEDTRKFQSLFNSAVGKSTIRKTSQEKEAKNLVKSFRDQTDEMLKTFENNRQADASLRIVLNSASQIEKQMNDISLGGETSTQWSRIKSELATLSEQFNIPMPRT
jgi:hypothetical protein